MEEIRIIKKDRYIAKGASIHIFENQVNEEDPTSSLKLYMPDQETLMRWWTVSNILFDTET